MASITSKNSLFHCFLLGLVCIILSNFTQVFASGSLEGAWHIVDVESLLPNSHCSSSEETSSDRLTITHRRGPCSPNSPNSKPNHFQILNQDQDRVDSIHNHISTSKKDKLASSLSVSLPARPGISFGTGNYIVKIGLGTPKKDFSVVFDTGSDLSWIQCKPCNDCYNQTDPLFDPVHSTTYSNISCLSNECTQLDSYSCSTDNKCLYEVTYGDNSQTDGHFVRDTLTLSSYDKLPNFMFGCGNDNKGLFGKSDGLIGLGRNKVSLVSQASQKYGAMFSYCLPSTSSSIGYLSIGGKAPSNTGFTSMIQKPSTPSFYYLNVAAIKVGGKLLSIPQTAFSNTGTVIDSGTVITRLPPTAYNALKIAFRQQMKRYKLVEPLSILDTCYDFSSYKIVKIPKISIVFTEGASLDVDFTGILYVSRLSQACLAFAGNREETTVGILGNTQQKRTNVVYDIANEKIGFASRGCK
ncbi:hypothetical protein LUZ60_003322 [Juncus effusus]|nr:hypothetical protein LUZ60_003322 [Juncus effusus]